MKNGGPAFARPFATNYAVKSIEDMYSVEAQDGMSLRDYFAATALQGILADIETHMKATRKHGIPEDAQAAEIVAAFSYSLADAMLKEREKDSK